MKLMFKFQVFEKLADITLNTKNYETQHRS
jgi:hypothetical protein